MERSESIIELAKAVSKCQSQIKSVVTDAGNPFYHSKYATLSECWDVARKPLTDNGLSVLQLPQEVIDSVKLETILLHSSGEFITSCYIMKPVKNDPQGVGSCLTYLRRYALCSVVGLAPTNDDDDGNVASGKVAGNIKQPESKANSPKEPARPNNPVEPTGSQVLCENPNCKKVMDSQKVIDYSMANFNGKIYCYDCQKIAKEAKVKK